MVIKTIWQEQEFWNLDNWKMIGNMTKIHRREHYKTYFKINGKRRQGCQRLFEFFSIETINHWKRRNRINGKLLKENIKLMWKNCWVIYLVILGVIIIKWVMMKITKSLLIHFLWKQCISVKKFDTWSTMVWVQVFL